MKGGSTGNTNKKEGRGTRVRWHQKDRRTRPFSNVPSTQHSHTQAKSITDTHKSVSESSVKNYMRNTAAKSIS